MQKSSPSEYYKKWVQAKISRLKTSGKPVEEFLEKISEIESKNITIEK